MQTFLKYLLIGALLIGAWIKHDEINTIFFVAWGRVEEALGLRPPLEAEPVDPPLATTISPAHAPPLGAPPNGTPRAPAVQAPPPREPPAPLTPLPENVWLLRERVSIMTDTGVRGVESGTLVDLIRKEIDHWVVSDGEGEFEVKPSQVTQDRSAAMPTPSTPPRRAPAPALTPVEGLPEAPISFDPQAAERRNLENQIVQLKLSLAAQSKQLDELVRTNPKAYTLGRATTPQAQQLVNSIQQTQLRLQQAQARLRALPSPPAS